MYDVGRVCVKIAGRDAGRKCVIVDNVDDNHVLIDGQTRRRRCSITHLDATSKQIKIKKNASNKEVVDALNKEGIKCVEKKERPKEQKDEKKEDKPEPKKKPAAKKKTAKKKTASK